ncbi:uncharacterized protein DUF3151 [Sediminihabitans luteus]|uniref:Uncharacterized protein DUF3151 n=1 Tax=Sediminihabitans luteus TaxID=1138585 RepID=A0A2M9D0C7_9CELL|nr:DUF3151 family protein [Sediminihabitans luteus]PJJ77641.1 uncharacterized protein DUF3151 [Sediminihabitans luteus]GII98541.1 hypothetical protein Slu03_09190 [Sediminihabitans luteus]
MTSTPAPRPAHPAQNLLGGPAPTLLPDTHPDVAARAALAAGEALDAVTRTHPASSYVWAVLAEIALDGDDPVAAYAYARAGYHRGLDALRRAGWRGQGPIPADHAANQGFLRALLALADAAEEIGEDDEAARCTQFLVDSGTSADEVRTLR